MTRIVRVLTTIVMLIAGVSGAAAAGPIGQISQAADSSGCLHQTGANTCATVTELSEPRSVAVSPDGKNVYVTNQTGQSVLIFDRSIGTLTRKAGTAGCISETGSPSCLDGVGLIEPETLAISPDGKNVYVASNHSLGQIAVFDRNLATGALTQKAGTAACVQSTSSASCAGPIKSLGYVRGLVVSPDGLHVYATNFVQDAVIVLDRDPTTGALTQTSTGTNGCAALNDPACAPVRAMDGPEEIAISPDGDNLYVAGVWSNAIAALAIDPTSGQLTQSALLAGCIQGGFTLSCVQGRGLSMVHGLAVSPDGNNVYAAAVATGGTPAFTTFARARTGGLTQLSGAAGCIAAAAIPNCGVDATLKSPDTAVISPDGGSVYLTDNYFGVLIHFTRATATGALTRTGCLANVAGCTSVRAIGGATGIAMAPNGANLYVAGAGSNSVAVIKREVAPACASVALDATSGPATAGVSCADANGDPLSVFVASAPAQGVASLLGPQLTYTPSVSAGGTDTFTIAASDGANTSAPATVTVALPPPVAPTLTPPTVLGTRQLKQVVTCAVGTTTGKPAPTIAYRWLRNGALITGATTAKRTIALADQGTKLACRTTATNLVGTAVTTSPAVAVPPKLSVQLRRVHLSVRTGRSVAVGFSTNRRALARLTVRRGTTIVARLRIMTVVGKNRITWRGRVAGLPARPGRYTFGLKLTVVNEAAFKKGTIDVTY